MRGACGFSGAAPGNVGYNIKKRHALKVVCCPGRNVTRRERIFFAKGGEVLRESRAVLPEKMSGGTFFGSAVGRREGEAGPASEKSA